jgi:hypothetical protein
MAAWDTWGYWGVVIGLVASLATFFVGLQVMLAASKTAGGNEESGAQREPSPTTGKRAA